jgi:hypothetical protein
MMDEDRTWTRENGQNTERVVASASNKNNETVKQLKNETIQ